MGIEAEDFLKIKTLYDQLSIFEQMRFKSQHLTMKLKFPRIKDKDNFHYSKKKVNLVSLLFISVVLIQTDVMQDLK